MGSGWNPQLYQERHAFVWQAAEDLLGWLEPKQGERILDLGCGTGQLTAKIAASGAQVTGLDRSPAMIEEARRNFPGIAFEEADAAAFRVAEPFDAIFSNAALHWVLDAAGAVRSMSGAVKVGGRLVVEFGGKTNVAALVHGAVAAAREVGVTIANPWYFPSIAEYGSLLEANGFLVRRAALFPRMTELAGEEGLRGWFRMFGGTWLEAVGEANREQFLQRAEQELRAALYWDGNWHADYCRLRILAERVKE